MDFRPIVAGDIRYIEAKSHLLELARESTDTLTQVHTQLERLLRELRHEETGCALQTSQERQKIDQRIANFAYEKSAAWQEISARHWDSLRQSELLSIAQVLGNKLGIEVDREAKRRKSVLVKWFDENLMRLRPLFDYIDVDYAPLSPSETRPSFL
jgi:hypothetical protein